MSMDGTMAHARRTLRAWADAPHLRFEGRSVQNAKPGVQNARSRLTPAFGCVRPSLFAPMGGQLEAL